MPLPYARPETFGQEPEGDRYDEMSREELYEEAQELGIPGRSKMSREELIDALRNPSPEAEAEGEKRLT